MKFSEFHGLQKQGEISKKKENENFGYFALVLLVKIHAQGAFFKIDFLQIIPKSQKSVIARAARLEAIHYATTRFLAQIYAINALRA